MLLVDDMAASADLLGTLAADAMTKPWVSGLLRARMRSWLIRTRLGQSKRLAAVERTGLPDKPTSEALDRLTRLIARILNAPVALISLVDANRQFFAAQVGLAEPWASARQTPLTHSFCQHVAATDAPLVVADARDHPLLKDNRAIPELNVVAYAGMPLAGDEGQTLGSVCIIDSTPRTWTEMELDILREFAGIAGAMIAERTAAHA
jgi:GAF domain-containing protein